MGPSDPGAHAPTVGPLLVPSGVLGEKLEKKALFRPGQIVRDPLPGLLLDGGINLFGFDVRQLVLQHLGDVGCGLEDIVRAVVVQEETLLAQLLQHGLSGEAVQVWADHGRQ